MAELVVTALADVGNDVLAVTASDGTNSYEAFGWVSATKNHFDVSAYGDDGHRDEKSLARAMTDVERGEYALALILEQNPEFAAVSPPVQTQQISFVAPAAVAVADPPPVPAE